MSLGGVPLFELVRPPEGYRTAGAVVTTYSAELVVCFATLAALDGAALEKNRVGRVDAVKALDRLRDRVRIVAHQSRVQCHHGQDPRLLALLDGVVRTVPFDGRYRSFHPKVVITRQERAGFPDRFVLYVGSRNLTSSVDWDLGVGLVGTARGAPLAGTRKLPGLGAFVSGVRELVGDPMLGKSLSGLDDVWWEMPAGIDAMEFHFHGGRARKFDETALAALPDVGRVLLLSPFVRPETVTKLVTHFRRASSIRLVAGRSELDRLARSKARNLIACCGGNVEALSMFAATDDPRPPPEDSDDPEQKDDRSLHAKVCAVTNDDRATLIVGSANLTPPAWTGENWEAFVVARGSTTIADELQAWSQRATPYVDPPEPGSPGADGPTPLDTLRNRMATLELSLTEKLGTAPVLESMELGMLIAKSGCTVRVARLTTPASSTAWPAAQARVELEPCEPGQRTSFLTVTGRHGDEEATWVQTVTVTPPLTLDRDREAVVRILGADFLAYLASLLGTEVGNDLDADPPDRDGEKRTGSSPNKRERVQFRLEDLIRRVGADGKELAELDRAVASYRDVLAKAELDDEARAELRRFDKLWTAISEGLRIP